MVVGEVWSAQSTLAEAALAVAESELSSLCDNLEAAAGDLRVLSSSGLLWLAPSQGVLAEKVSGHAARMVSHAGRLRDAMALMVEARHRA